MFDKRVRKRETSIRNILTVTFGVIKSSIFVESNNDDPFSPLSIVAACCCCATKLVEYLFSDSKARCESCNNFCISTTSFVLSVTLLRSRSSSLLRSALISMDLCCFFLASITAWSHSFSMTFNCN